jgi:flavin-dependent dehydrogenase
MSSDSVLGSTKLGAIIDDDGMKVKVVSGDAGGSGLEYETVAAGQTAQVLGATGATGDYLSHVVFQPTAVGAGTCTVLDNATVIYTFTTGTLADLRPIVVPFNANSVSGAWKITTGANMAALGVGDFT